MDAIAAWFATRQAGHVARRQLLAARVTVRAIDRRVESGRLLTVHRGVYLVAHRAPAPWGKEFAAVLRCGPGAIVGSRSAVNVFGLLSYPAAGDVWITTTAERGAATAGIRLHTTRVLEPRDVCFNGWLPLASPARALFDTAGVVDDGRFEEAVAAAIGRGLVSEAELRDQLDRGTGRRGGLATRRLLERVAPPAATRSKAERLMLRLIRRAGLPEPLVNARLGRWRPDFLWSAYRVVAEFDSRAFHSDIRSFRRDREKSNELQLAGFTVLRFTWYELTRTPELLVARIREALEAGGFRG